MKKLLFALLLIPFVGNTQPFTLSSNSLDFQTVDYLAMDSIQLTLDNTTGYDIGVTGIDVFSVYGTKPFFVKDSVFTMNTGNSHNVWVYFEPEQNILHQMVAVIKTDFRGDYVIDLTGIGNFSSSYYSTTYNKSEQDLKDALKTRLAQGYQQQSYNVARDNMYATIDNVNGDVTCVYTGRVATFNTRTGANANSFNCEHTFPQSKFNQSLPMRSDVHHLFSTDVTANSRRGSDPFGVVTGTPSWSVGGSKSGGSTFEPRDAQKGQTARALFYFVIRYQDYDNHVQGQESILRTWINQYPPTASDIQRNNDIYALQSNRNPFVDYPQLLKRITKIVGTSTAVDKPSLYVSRNVIDMGSSIDSTLYTFSIVNTGNTLVSLTNFAISSTTNFSFENAMSNAGLLPGEALEVLVRATPTSSALVDEQLTFETDVPGMNTVTVDLKANWGLVSTSEVLKNNGLEMFPNPTANSCVISWAEKSSFEIEVYNLAGDMVLNQTVSGATKELNVSEFPAGVYVVKAIANGEIKHLNLVVK
jgi:endonuclease I